MALNTHQWVQDLIRDKNLSSKVGIKDTIAESTGVKSTHDYYLRRKANHIEVDHVFECQLLAHCIESESSVLRFLKKEGITTSSTVGGQSVAVKNFLQPIYDGQNGQSRGHIVDDPFNLRLMDESLNIYKGKAYKAFLKDKSKGLETSMQSSLLDCKALERSEREDVCGKIISELRSVHSRYDTHLESINNDHAKKYEKLKEEINQLYDKMDI